MPQNNHHPKRGSRRAALKRRIRSALQRVRGTTEETNQPTIEVRFIDADDAEIANVCASPGVSILALAIKANVEIDHFCGGQCSCGTCRIVVIDGMKRLSKMTGMEEMTLGAKHVSSGCRLACQARIEGPITVQVPRWF